MMQDLEQVTQVKYCLQFFISDLGTLLTEIVWRLKDTIHQKLKDKWYKISTQ